MMEFPFFYFTNIIIRKFHFHLKHYKGMVDAIKVKEFFQNCETYQICHSRPPAINYFLNLRAIVVQARAGIQERSDKIIHRVNIEETSSKHRVNIDINSSHNITFHQFLLFIQQIIPIRIKLFH